MKNRKLILTIVAVILFLVPVIANAQHVLTSNSLAYHSFRMPQGAYLNPAFTPRNADGYVSLPSFNFNFGFPISYKEVGLTYDPTKKVSYIDINNLMETLGENTNKFHISSEIGLFGFGVNFGKLFFTFNTSINFNSTVCIPIDIFNVLSNLEGSSWVGAENAVTLASNDLALVNTYGRISLGGGYEFETLPLTIGGRINILDGFENFNTDETNIKIYSIDEHYSSVIADVDYHLQRAGCLNIDTNSKTKIKLSGFPENLGFTIDLGAKFEMGRWTFSTSLLDFGPGIHWKENVVKTKPQHSSFEFNGFDITNLVSNGIFDSTFASRFRDSVINVIGANEMEGGDFWYAIPTKLNVGASYTFLNNFFRAGFLFHGEWEKGLMCTGKGFSVKNNNFRYNTTLSLTANLYDWLEVMIGNSIVFDGENSDYVNPGAGIVITPFRAIQLYAIADYVSDLYIVDAKAFNCTFGLNILLSGNHRK